MSNLDNTKIERLKKLLNKAESAKEIGSLAEANAFSAKISKLLLELNLSMSDLKDLNKEKSDVSESEGIEFSSMFGKTWSIELANQLAKHNFCTLIFNTYCLYLIGKTENIVHVRHMLEFLQGEFLKLASEDYSKTIQNYRDQLGFWLEEDFNKSIIAEEYSARFRFGLSKLTEKDIVVDYTKPKNSQGKRFFTIKDPAKLQLTSNRSTFIRNFLEGAVCGIALKLREQAKENEQEFGEKQVQGLVHVQEQKNRDYLNENHPNLNKTKLETSHTKDSQAFNSGYQAGQETNINKQLQ